jgi:hypothetical protein
MIELPLTQGRVALIDDADTALLSQWRWQWLPNRRGGYAVRQESVGGQRRTIYLHRFLLEAEAGAVVDHINGNGLDNQRSNLRCVTRSQNMANRQAPARSIAYRGVYTNKRGLPFRAQITRLGRDKHLGAFATAIEAARAYDRAAWFHFGCAAQLNFPGEMSCEPWQLDTHPDVMPDAPARSVRFDQFERGVLLGRRLARTTAEPIDLVAIDDCL